MHYNFSMHCHQSCSKEQRIWLPVSNGDLVPHPWCIKCGAIKNISDDKAKRMGYWTNVMAEIAEYFKISKVQQRLAIKELETYDGFEDTYAMTFSAQKKIFAEILKKYFGLNEITIESFIR